jgi:rhodanese-related sulfurtransferase
MGATLVVTVMQVASLLAAGLVVAPVHAAAGTAEAITRCNPGANPNAGGGPLDPPGTRPGEAYVRSADAMTRQIKGAKTVTPREAKCLMDTLGERLVVVQVMNDDQQLPGAQAVSELGSSDEGEQAQRALAGRLAELTGGDLKRPLLFYCHHTRCGLSYNASIRAVKSGYRQVYWLREGNSGWVRAGLPLKGEAMTASGIPLRAQESLDSCRITLEEDGFVKDYVGIDRAYRRRVVAEYERCLTKVRHAFLGNADVLSLVRDREDASREDVDAAFEATRTRFEATPSLFQDELGRVDVPALNGMLSERHWAFDIDSRCAPLPTHSGPLDESQRADASARGRAYRSCLDEVELRVAEENERSWEEFRNAIRLVDGVANFTCDRTPQPDCLPDASWRRVADVATAGNLKIMENLIWRSGIPRRAALAKGHASADEWINALQ